MPGTDPDPEFIYDVAIIYTDSTLRWAKHLNDVCEKAWGLKIFLFDRDSELGASIADNWTENLVRSRRILLLASGDLDTDEWAQFAGLVVHAFSPAGRRARLAIVLLRPCLWVRKFNIFAAIDYTCEDTRDFFWIKIYRTCTGRRVTKERDIPGFGGDRCCLHLSMEARQEDCTSIEADTGELQSTGVDEPAVPSFSVTSSSGPHGQIWHLEEDAPAADAAPLSLRLSPLWRGAVTMAADALSASVEDVCREHGQCLTASLL